MLGLPGGQSPDALTRTTLQMDSGMSNPSLARVIAALQHVPGVLLAEANGSTARAIVAHDAAVPAASLLAAVVGAGAHAKILTGPGRPAVRVATGLQLQSVRTRRLVMVAAAIFLPLALVDILLPNMVEKNWLLPVFITALWVFIFAEAFVGRRQ